MHEHELVHRDLKSANVLLDADGRAKLCDFGFSTLRSEAKETSDVGTRIWNAPEVLEGKTATSASDIFSFAIICLEVATRQIPYVNHPLVRKKQMKELEKQIHAGYRENIPDDCPPVLDSLIRACWSHDPAKRPNSRQGGTSARELVEGKYY